MRLECILGPAGSGKSYLLNERLKADRRFAMLSATTGVAALNLGPTVTTVNSVLGFYNLETLRENHLQVVQKMVHIAYQYKALVIDEVSMLDAEVLDEIYGCWQDALSILDRLRDGEPSQFGLILTGDFLQLPPVHGKYAFKAKCWPEFERNLTVLTKIWRQTDKAFSQALNHARRGKGTSCAVELVKLGVKFVETPDRDFPGTTLYPVRDSVNLHNRESYAKLQGEELSELSIRWGKQMKDWDSIPDKLSLKVGTKVMALANCRGPLEGGDEGLIYANGSIGQVVGMEEQSNYTFRVAFDITGYEGPVKRVQRTNSTKRLPRDVEGMEWTGPEPPEDMKALGGVGFPGEDEEVRGQWIAYLKAWRAYVQNAREKKRAYWDPITDQWVLGTVNYVPLQMAYALTFHKAQGLTLETAQIDVRSLQASKEGMVYVALSRVRSAEGLVIVGNPTQLAKRIITNDEVRRWA